MLFFIGAAYFWRLGDEINARKHPAQPAQPTAPPKTASQASPASFPLLTTQGILNSWPVSHSLTNHASRITNRFANRLTNSSKTVGELARSDRAILMENVMLDTEQPISLAIPDHLRSKGDPGAYIVKSRTAPDDNFRALLKNAGATQVSYIPNNAYLVRLSSGAAQDLAAQTAVETVLPFEPYFKLKDSLLNLAVKQLPLPDNSALNLLVFADAKEATLSELKKLGVQVMSEERSPFGPILKVRPPVGSLPALAGLAGVQEVEMLYPRKTANDLMRVRLGVAEDSTTDTNYLGLSGKGVLINVNDTGIDATHPDLAPRVFGDVPGSLIDTSSHGTHVAGIIASSGSKSSTLTTNAEGSLPATNTQFRGMAPAATLFSMSYLDLDGYLQEAAARTNAFISNNSWNYGDAAYDIAAASYDAAVRDALPGLPGSHPLLYVFSAGNDAQINNWDEGSNDDGTGGTPGTILSPGTSKNVITVGALEQSRMITNEVQQCTLAGGTNECVTNTPWLLSSDSSNQVASFSSRGNVGIGTEGIFGRFKPDVVAPGSWVISTRSATWDQGAYYNPTSHIGPPPFFGLQLQTNNWFFDSFDIPNNAVQVTLTVSGTSPSADIPIYLRQSAAPTTNTYDWVGTNQVSMPPAGGGNLVRGVSWNYALANPLNRPVTCNFRIDMTVTNEHGDFLQVLSNMNYSIGPYYRYESGTSLAAAGVSGTLALMQEFFEQRMHQTNSPALMKALLINGARSVGNLYNLQVENTINFQGWGLVHLQNSLPSVLTNSSPSGSSIFMLDQSPANALATGQFDTRTFKLNTPDARDQPLRITLVWTDPPGNPLAGLKLVNDLDLVVTNLDNPNPAMRDVFFGNDIAAGNDFTLPWDTNLPPNVDVVNNVENIYLLPPLGTNYSITVRGKRVNVNAVTAHTNNVVQDYALVISSGNGEVTNAFSLVSDSGSISTSIPNVTMLTNNFAESPTDVGQLLLQERIGASPPLLGTNTVPLPPSTNSQITVGITNQWHFYVLTNTTSFTNLTIALFDAHTLSVPRMGVRETSELNATRQNPEADIDLYVSRNQALTNLNPAAIAAADKSLGRGGEEVIISNNASPGTYYIGVKSESAEGVEYSLLADLSLLPPGDGDDKGFTAHGIPRIAAIPDDNKVGAVIVALAYGGKVPTLVRRAIVTNTVTHTLMGDLLGTLTRRSDFAVLNNHSPDSAVVNRTFVYDDSGQHDVINSRRTDGPGSLKSFRGKSGRGIFKLTQVDDAFGHIGTNLNFDIWLEKQTDLTEGVPIHLLPGECDDELFIVPTQATNTAVSLTISNGGPVLVSVCTLDAPSCASGCKSAIISAPGGTITIDSQDDPPLNPGTYVVTVCNIGAGNFDGFLKVTNILGPQLEGTGVQFRSSGVVPILDDAVSYGSMSISSTGCIRTVEVGVRIAHPRISDLVMHLISPDGTRLLLSENRGAFTPSGMGYDINRTNVVPVDSDGDWHPSTNIIDTGITSGNLAIDWDFYPIPDRMTVYYQGTRIFDSGLVPGPGTTNLTYGPGTSTTVTIVMNEGNTNQTSTKWRYVVTSSVAQYVYTTFTESTNETLTPIKFAIPPYTNANYIGTNAALTNEIFYQPEDELGLNRFVGQSAAGTWRLEVWDNRVGATNPTPLLKGWQLSFVFENMTPLPVVVTNDVPVTNTVPPGKSQCFIVDVPNWASYASNQLFNINPSRFLSLWYNPLQPPTGTNAGDALLFATQAGATNVLTFTNGAPLLVRNSQYYLCVNNTNTVPVTYSLQVDFDVTPLSNGIPVTGIMASNAVPRYFSYDVTSNETAVSFLLTNLSGNVNLVARKGTPFPSPADYDYGSFSPGTNDEAINIFTSADTAPLTPGHWYLGVFNADVTNVSYTIVVVDYTNAFPPIITLFNQIPYTNSNAGAVNATNDYYRYVVSTNAVRAQFEIDRPSADMTLVARKGLPLPTLGSYDLISANPGTADELISIFNSSRPIALTPGEWFLTAVNVSGTPANYTIMASEFSVYGTNIVITNIHAYSNSFLCITWTSVPGLHYYIQGKADLTSTNWVMVAPNITATDYSTTYCIPLPSPLHYFRVGTGVAPAFSALPVNITSITRDPGGVTLRWIGLTNAIYQVQWSPSVAPVTWNSFSGTVTSLTGQFSYRDDGSQTGGLGGRRYYRLRQLP
jgi:subtilisin-like proprotein convertase family protein